MIHFIGQRKIFFLVLLSLLTVLIFSIFRWISFSENQSHLKTVRGVLRSEYLQANSYALSKALSDLETIGIIRCTLLIEEFTEAPRIYYNTSSSEDCQSTLLKSLLTSESTFKAINGLTYTLSYQRPPRWSLIILEFLSYAFAIFGLLFSFSRFEQMRLKQGLKLQVAELERKILEGRTRQISHDMASPIGLFRVLIGSLENIDERSKSIFISALNRTDEIFSQLKSVKDLPIKGELVPIDLHKLTKEIVSEKTFAHSDVFSLRCSLPNPPIALGNATSYQRMLSNVLNNSLESFVDWRPGKVSVTIEESGQFLSVQIQDNGRGVPKELLDKIGTEGFSYGKENFENSGSGIGVFNAIHTLQSWGGSFRFESHENVGTTVTLELRQFQSS